MLIITSKFLIIISALIILTVICAPNIYAAECQYTFGSEIPSLPWQERSDWINVKTDVTPNAKGDGKSDDSQAIQAALDLIGPRPGDPKVVYLPAGQYRISKTLNIRERQGGMIIGNGRDTEIFWSGELGERMIWSNGFTRSSFIGFILNGRQIASVGIDHDSKTLYETRVLHQHLVFRNFLIAGSRIGHDQKIASAEQMFFNTIFENNKNGVLFQAVNNYNNIFDGCHFTNNSIGINVEKGQVVVRNSRFENSKSTDLYLWTHSHSVRRVYSNGSNAFIRTARGPYAPGIITVQDVIVKNWQSENGAIATSLRGPITIFDALFENGPGISAPIQLSNPSHVRQLALLASISTSINVPSVDAGENGKVIDIGTLNNTGNLDRLGEYFIKNTWPVPNNVVDVKEDCGAIGNGKANDTTSIQQCINKIEKNGKNSLLYFPSGYYLVNKTLNFDSSSFQMGGTGWHSAIILTDKSNGPLLNINNPKGLTISHIAFGGRDGIDKLKVTGPSNVHLTLQNVYGWHDDPDKNTGLKIENISKNSAVIADHFDGTIDVNGLHSSDILIGFHNGRSIKSRGIGDGKGLFGVLSRASCCSSWPLEIMDNQSIIVTDWYNEQTDNLVRAYGNNTDYGYITLDHSKAESDNSVISNIYNYRGRISHTGGLFGNPDNYSPSELKISNKDNTKFLLYSNMFWNNKPNIYPLNSNSIFMSNNIIQRKNKQNTDIPDQGKLSATYKYIKFALDDFSKLSSKDLTYNYCR